MGIEEQIQAAIAATVRPIIARLGFKQVGKNTAHIEGATLAAVIGVIGVDSVSMVGLIECRVTGQSELTINCQIGSSWLETVVDTTVVDLHQPTPVLHSFTPLQVIAIRSEVRRLVASGEYTGPLVEECIRRAVGPEALDMIDRIEISTMFETVQVTIFVKHDEPIEVQDRQMARMSV